jgi:hypothetical protein
MMAIAIDNMTISVALYRYTCTRKKKEGGEARGPAASGVTTVGAGGAGRSKSSEYGSRVEGGGERKRWCGGPGVGRGNGSVDGETNGGERGTRRRGEWDATGESDGVRGGEQGRGEQGTAPRSDGRGDERGSTTGRLRPRRRWLGYDHTHGTAGYGRADGGLGGQRCVRRLRRWRHGIHQQHATASARWWRRPHRRRPGGERRRRGWSRWRTGVEAEGTRPRPAARDAERPAGGVGGRRGSATGGGYSGTRT